MNRTERLYRIDQILKRSKGVTRAELLKALEVSSATLTRDIEYMRSQLHAPIVFDPDAGYRFDTAQQVGAPYAMPGLWFNESEIHGLLAIENLLESIQPGLLEPHIAPLRERLNGLLGEGRFAPAEVRRRVRLQPSTPRCLVSAHFQTCATATLSRRRLQIVHYDRHGDARTTREVSPQRLVRYKENWYLDTWCHVREAVRTFAVDALCAAEIVDAAAVEVPDAELDAVLGAGYGIYAGKDVAWATLRFTPFQARWTAPETWHPDQRGHYEPDGCYVLEIPYSAPGELLMDILKYGADVEVVAPVALRAAVAEALWQAAQRYRA
jgi:predicted DNA-binding transcriptional regulator YafY